jgi:acetyltransferase-like isoleucine patch superfamily enzyme
VGANATVIQGVSICDFCIIGAGAVVTRSLERAGTYVGAPARRAH